MAHVMKIINSNVIETYCSLHSKINQQGFSIIENVIVSWTYPMMLIERGIVHGKMMSILKDTYDRY